VNELSKTLRLPARTLHRRVEKGQKLTSEETERSVRTARALARDRSYSVMITVVPGC